MARWFRTLTVPSLRIRCQVPLLLTFLGAYLWVPAGAETHFFQPRGNMLVSPALNAPTLSNEEAQALVLRVLRTELEATRDLNHPMRYRIRKTSPRLSTTKLIVETRDGDVARLVAINNQALGAADEHNEETRLQALANDPSLQRHRKEREEGDTERARKVMRALSRAFLYQYAGIIETPHGPSYRLTFLPNPDFAPQDVEAQVLKAMAGELWIDVAQQRVTHLEGHRLHDVDYGWGLLGKLDRGGTILLEQADVGSHQWRTVHMVLTMNARVLLKVIKLDTALEMTQFSPVETGITYKQAIQLLAPTTSIEPGLGKPRNRQDGAE